MTNRTDNFNRTNTSTNIGTPSDAGSDWVQVSGVWGIFSNTGYKSSSAGPYEICYLESSVSDVDVQVTLNLVESFSGLAGRIADDNNHLLLRVSVPGASATVDFFKKVAGTYTQLGSPFVGLVTTGDIFKLSMSGSSLTVYQNSVSIITASDGAGSSNTKHGLYSNAVNNSFDDFSITAIAAGGVFGSNFYRQVAGLGGGF